MEKFPDDINEEAYGFSDLFSDWYGCDSAKRQALTNAFSRAIMDERQRQPSPALARRNAVQEFIDFSGEVINNDLGLTPAKKEMAKAIMRALVVRWNAANL